MTQLRLSLIRFNPFNPRHPRSKNEQRIMNNRRLSPPLGDGGLLCASALKKR
jgi:hypothetical protein